MKSRVNGIDLYVCQGTGEPFEEPVFKLPWGNKWKGCYSSPSIALQKLQNLLEEDEIPEPLCDQYAQMFRASLKRTEFEPHTAVTVNIAPPFSVLQRFGGSMSLEDYQKQYSHDFQRKVFIQKIPKVEESWKRVPAWNHTRVGMSKTGGTEAKYPMPKNYKGWREFLSGRGYPTTVVFHPDKSKRDTFCVYDARNMALDEVNANATRMMGNVTVYGPAEIFHKKDLSKRKRNKNKEPGIEVKIVKNKKKASPR